jgi:squalene-hopene cyclase-like protein
MRLTLLYGLTLSVLCLSPVEANEKLARTAGDRAASWLRKHQSTDGSWRSFYSNCASKDTRCAGMSEGPWAIGVDALALYSLLESGKGQDPAYKQCLERGLSYLLRKQSKRGALGFESADGRSIYNHALSLLALARYQREFPSKDLEEKLTQATYWALDSQNPGLGWKYGRRTGRNDTSVTTWMIRALAESQRAGVRLEEGGRFGALNWLKRVTDSRGEIGYETPGGGSSWLKANDGKYDPVPAMTGMGLWGRFVCGDSPSEKSLKGGVQRLVESPPLWSGRQLNFYAWHASAQALSRVGGKKFSKWKKALFAALIPNQSSLGCSKGSWPPRGEWCLAGGRVYGTAINLLSLTRSLEAENCVLQKIKPRATHGGYLNGSPRDEFVTEVLITSGLIELFLTRNGKPVPLDGVSGTGIVTIHPKSKKDPPRLEQIELKALLKRRPWHHSIYARCRIGSKIRRVDIKLALTGVPGFKEELPYSLSRRKLAKKPQDTCWACATTAANAKAPEDTKDD